MIGLADGDDDWSNSMIVWYDAEWAFAYWIVKFN